MAVAGMFAAACSQDDELVNMAEQVTINPGIKAGVVQSRATGTPLATINPAAQLLLEYGSQSTTFIYNSTAAKWEVKSGETPLYWDKLTANIGSQFTFTAMAPADYSAGGSVANQATDAAYLAADLLATTYTATSRKEVLNLELEHQLAQMAVTVTSTDADFDLNAATLVVKGAKPGYDADAVATGNAANITPLAKGDGSFVNVLPAQTVAVGALKLEFVINVAGTANTYTWTNADALTFVKGESTAINLGVSKTGVTTGDVKVVDWVQANPINETIQMVVSGTPGSATGVAPEFDTFQLWKNDDEAKAITYNLVDGAWQLAAGNAPFYLDEVASDDVFHARHTPADDQVNTVTGQKDILEARDVTVQGGQVALTFTHINAKLTVKLVKGTDFSTAIDLKDAEVTLLTYSEKANGASHDFILAPTTINANTQIVSVALQGLTYKAILTNELKLETGKHTTLTVTLNPTETTVAVAVTDWTTETATGTAEVTLTPNSLDALPAVAGTLTLKCGSQTGTYVWSGTAISSTTTELYWENIPEAASYSFTLTFTPDAADAVTYEKDILEATTTVNTRGAQPSFTADNALAHINAKLTIKLLEGTDFNADITGATIKLLGFDAVTLIGTDTSKEFIMATTTAIAAGTQVATITTKQGLVYKAITIGAIAFPAGMNTILHVMLRPTVVTMTVSVTDWWKQPETGEATKVTIDANDLSALPGSGTLLLAYGTTYSTQYTWTGSTLSLGNNEKDIYWENIPETNAEAFTLTFTPDATGTPEKDVLKKTISSYTHGAALTFELVHINSQINVTLAKGGTYSDADWDAIQADNKTTVSFAGLSTSDYAPVYDYSKTELSAIFAPKTAIAEDDKITVSIPAIGTTVNANTVSIALKNYMSSLEAGKKYDITITVDKTKVSVGDIKVAEWTTITGSGEMDY